MYFAAPDIDSRTFALEHVPRYHDMTQNTTLTMHTGDKVLGLSAAVIHGRSRAGAPNAKEFEEDELLMIRELARLPTFNVVDMEHTTGERGQDFQQHGYWYKNPWVSTDLIFQLMFRVGPAERGLEKVDVEQRPVWYFPPDYPQRVKQAVLEHAGKRAD